MTKRKSIHAEITPIKPFDVKEMKTQRQVLAWIDSVAEIFRLLKSATPPNILPPGSCGQAAG